MKMGFFNNLVGGKTQAKKAVTVKNAKKAKPNKALKKSIKKAVKKSQAKPAKKTVKKAVKSKPAKSAKKILKKTAKKSIKKAAKRAVTKSAKKAIRKTAKATSKKAKKKSIKLSKSKSQIKKQVTPKPVKRIKVMEFKNPEKVRACPECGSRRVRYSEFNQALICKECGVMYPELDPALEQTYVDLQR